MDADDSLPGDWHYAPLAEPVDAPVSPFTRMPELSGSERVVGIGAFCDFTSEPVGDNPGLNIIIFEHCILHDGQKVHLDERGFSWSPVRWTDGVSVETPESVPRTTLESLTQEVLNCVLPDDEPDGSPPKDDHPWEDLARSARETGMCVRAEELRRLKYVVQFAERVTRWIDAGQSNSPGRSR